MYLTTRKANRYGWLTLLLGSLAWYQGAGCSSVGETASARQQNDQLAAVSETAGVPASSQTKPAIEPKVFLPGKQTWPDSCSDGQPVCSVTGRPIYDQESGVAYCSVDSNGDGYDDLCVPLCGKW